LLCVLALTHVVTAVAVPPTSEPSTPASAVRRVLSMALFSPARTMFAERLKVTLKQIFCHCRLITAVKSGPKCLIDAFITPENQRSVCSTWCSHGLVFDT
jgi:hypothetical protein